MRDTMAYLAVAADGPRHEPPHQSAHAARARRIRRAARRAVVHAAARPVVVAHDDGVSHVGERRLRRRSSTRSTTSTSKFVWYGATSRLELSARRAAARRRRQREHVRARPRRVRAIRTSMTPLYFNTGHKQDAQRLRQARRTRSGARRCSATCRRGTPNSATRPTRTPAIAGPSIGWTFLNPKVGATYAVSAPLSLYVSYGKNSREPARSDMFAGFDNLDTSNVAFVGAARPREAGNGARRRGGADVPHARRSSSRPTCTRWTSGTRSRRSAC